MKCVVSLIKAKEIINKIICTYKTVSDEILISWKSNIIKEYTK